MLVDIQIKDDQLIWESLPKIEVLRGGKWQIVALQISPKIESNLYGLGRQATNYKPGLVWKLQLLQGSHLDNFPLKALKLGLVAFHSETFQLKCLLDFQWNHYKKQIPVLSCFCNGLYKAERTRLHTKPLTTAIITAIGWFVIIFSVILWPWVLVRSGAQTLDLPTRLQFKVQV